MPSRLEVVAGVPADALHEKFYASRMIRQDFAPPAQRIPDALDAAEPEDNEAEVEAAIDRHVRRSWYPGDGHPQCDGDCPSDDPCTECEA
jgi:hypothetical protein